MDVFVKPSMLHMSYHLHVIQVKISRLFRFYENNVKLESSASEYNQCLITQYHKPSLVVKQFQISRITRKLKLIMLANLIFPQYINQVNRIVTATRLEPRTT